MVECVQDLDFGLDFDLVVCKNTLPSPGVEGRGSGGLMRPITAGLMEGDGGGAIERVNWGCWRGLPQVFFLFSFRNG